MRSRNHNSDIQVQIVSGIHSVFLGINAKEFALKNLLGFAIRRTDSIQGQQQWLSGIKMFKELEPNPQARKQYSLLEHPAQCFQWVDSSVKSNHKYIYDVVPMYGSPNNLIKGAHVTVEISTESEIDLNGQHDIYFSRGILDCQEYISRFGNVPPFMQANKLSNKEYNWLSQGISDPLIKFISQANNKKYSIRASVSNFESAVVINAFRNAHSNGADVRIVHNAHNQFILLLYENKPIQVWVNPIDFTDTGIFAQFNIGHIVRDKNITNSYMSYWQYISNCLRPFDQVYREEKIEYFHNIYLEHARSSLLCSNLHLEKSNFLSGILNNEKSSSELMVTFGMNPIFEKILKSASSLLSYIILDSDQDVRIGDSISASKVLNVINSNDDPSHEFLERSIFEGKYINGNFMLVNPLGNQSIVIIGLANTTSNFAGSDEKYMLGGFNSEVRQV